MLNKLKNKLPIILTAVGLAINQVALAQAKCTVNGKEVDCAEAGAQLNGLFGGLFVIMIIMALIGLAGTIFWVLMIIHAASKPIENRALWIIVMVFTGAVGAVIYYFVVKREFDKQSSPVSINLPPSSNIQP